MSPPVPTDPIQNARSPWEDSQGLCLSYQVGPGARPPVVRTLQGVQGFTRLGARRPRGCLPAASISHVRNGGKNTRGRVSPLWTPPLWFGMSFGVSLFFLYPGLRPCVQPGERARPPAGRAGRRGLVDRGTGSGKNPAKNILPKESLQIRARTWGCDKNNDRSVAALSQKRERAPASGLIPGGAGGNPLRSCVQAFSRKAWIPAPIGNRIFKFLL